MDLKNILPLLSGNKGGDKDALLSALTGNNEMLSVVNGLKSGNKAEALASLMSMNEKKRPDVDHAAIVNRIASQEILGAIVKYNSELRRKN